MEDGVIQKAIRLMESDFQVITLTAVAEKLYLTPSYLSHLFKHLTGKSFVEHLTEIRIKEAKKLLLETGMKNYEISDVIGYQNARYFSQMFKKHVGLLPNEFRSVAVSVYHKLKRMFIEGEFVSGQTLFVSETAERLAVSQDVVREALVILEKEGLFTTYRNEGTTVSDITVKDIRDAFELRELIEGYAVREVMKTLKSSDVLYLDKLLENMDVAVQEDNSYRMIELDMNFHEFFYVRCSNEAVLKTWKSIKNKIMRFNAMTNKGYTNEGLRLNHTKLKAVIQSGDVNYTVRQFIEHMQGYRRFKDPI
ncbi:helix-turn-helix domain-containing protein [Alicyclobacillus fodiniaquatilis]|uniref:Helix-turn-helix domain-containing protein n=1 Tax=Alicyclobacillus fodiniaquatilis TaxID=1661150 RepID=A0ABW4JD45_9BACL